MHYRTTIASPRWEDMDIQYHDENQWAHLGMGFVPEDKLIATQPDFSPCFSVDAIDKQWWEAMQSDGPAEGEDPSAKL
jgi:hydroxyversicolorone monooxygenase